MSEPDERFPPVMGELPPIEISRDLAFRDPANAAAAAYWRAKCRDRPMPTRSAVDPAEMRAFLPHVGLIEVPDGSVARPDYRIRLAGSVIEEALGALTGRLLQEAVPPVIARRWRQVYEVVVTDKVPIRALTQVSFEAKNFLTAELFAAPLSEDGVRVDTLLVTLAFWSNTGSATA